MEPCKHRAPQEDHVPLLFDAPPTRRSDVKSRVVEGETVVWDRKGGLIHQFNQTASYIWEQCDGLHTAGQIAQGLAEACDVDVQTAAHNVAETIRQLAKLNLLESCEG
jgi:methyltransferase-like protein